MSDNDMKSTLNLGMIGNCAYSALIDPQARMVWCCLPRFDGDQPPFYMGKCMTWDFNGPVVARVAPQFVGWVKPVRKG